MILELEDEELSVIGNEQNFYLIWFYYMISTENVIQIGLQKKKKKKRKKKKKKGKKELNVIL